jgi:hypothetical protein
VSAQHLQESYDSGKNDHAENEKKRVRDRRSVCAGVRVWWGSKSKNKRTRTDGGGARIENSQTSWVSTSRSVHSISWFRSRRWLNRAFVFEEGVWMVGGGGAKFTRFRKISSETGCVWINLTNNFATCGQNMQISYLRRA